MDNFNQVIIMGIIGYFAIAAKQVPAEIFSLFKNNFSYSISTNNRHEDQYDRINNWIMGLNKKCIINNANLVTRWKQGMNYSFKAINYGTYIFIYNKTLITINKYVSNSSSQMNGDIDYIKIRIFGVNSSKIYDELYRYTMAENKNGLLIEFLNEFGNFNCIISQNKKFDDIFTNRKNDIISHIDKWINNENFYLEHGLTYKTGILLYGTPGTGKTTIARAIATYLNCKITIIDFKSVKSIAELSYAINAEQERKVILLEDIDCICSNRDNENINSNDKEIIGFLLNLLDGVSSPSNSIFIATTNHIDKIDQAIIRSGRFDCKLELTNIDKKLAIEMCERFECNSDDLLKGESFPINPSYLQSKILDMINIIK